MHPILVWTRSGGVDDRDVADLDAKYFDGWYSAGWYSDISQSRTQQRIQQDSRGSHRPDVLAAS